MASGTPVGRWTWSFLSRLAATNAPSGPSAPLATRAELNEVRLHDLRHTFGVHCARAGVPLARIQKLMGHATLAMTLRYLQHAPESHFAQDAALVAASLSGAHDADAQAAAELLRSEIRPA
jgi:integrase